MVFDLSIRALKRTVFSTLLSCSGELQIPIWEKYTLTIPDHARPISDARIKLSFVPENVHLVGVTTFDYNDSKIRIYDKERLLIDTARMKGRLPPDQYKEVINYYRQIRDDLDGSKFPEYLELFPHRERIMQIIDTEVF